MLLDHNVSEVTNRAALTSVGTSYQVDSIVSHGLVIEVVISRKVKGEKIAMNTLDAVAELRSIE